MHVSSSGGADLGTALAQRRVLTAPQQICVSLEELILDGTLRPGDRLPRVDRMAESMCVCVPTANRALRAMREAGVLSVLRGRNGGYRVTEEAPRLLGSTRAGIGVQGHDGVTLHCYRQMLEVREVQDAYAARAAAENRTEEDLAELSGLLPDALPEDLEQLFDLDQRFHRTLAQCTHNPLIIRLTGTTALALRRFSRTLGGLSPADILAGLDEVVCAVRGRDGSAAATAMRGHLRRSTEFFVVPAERGVGRGDG